MKDEFNSSLITTRSSHLHVVSSSLKMKMATLCEVAICVALCRELMPVVDSVFQPLQLHAEDFLLFGFS